MAGNDNYKTYRELVELQDQLDDIAFGALMQDEYTPEVRATYQDAAAMSAVVREEESKAFNTWIDGLRSSKG